MTRVIRRGIIITLLLVLGLVILVFIKQIDHKYNRTGSQNPLETATANAKNELESELGTVDNNSLLMDLVTEIESENEVNNGIYSAKESVAMVLKYDESITKYADELEMPKEFLQAILIKEMSCQDYSDVVADNLVEKYFSQMEKKGSSKYNSDSSTGLGQIFSKTAIYSRNNLIKKGILKEETYSVEDLQIRKDVWNKLRNDNEYNIKYVAYTIKSMGINLGIDDFKNCSANDTMKILAAYNGSGEKAKEYGTIALKYYLLISKYETEK